MKVLICHERFLFRYGADRLFMLTARGLRERGHVVTMAAQRFDANVVSSVAERVIPAPSDCPYGELDEHTARWLEREWDELFPSAADAPEAAVVGGWPFYNSMAVLRSKGVPTVFSDVGRAPADGQPEEVRRALGQIGELRRRFLPRASAIAPISDFLAETQSAPDSGGLAPVTRIYPGADHLESRLWREAQVDSASGGRAVDLVRSLRRPGRGLILNLGRWEPSGYKSSPDAFELIAALEARGVEAHLLALAEPGELEPPPGLEGRVHGLGFPDDNELGAVMQTVDLNVSVSRWEGFNLPLAEAQWLGRPCLVLDIGAHPEVASHPFRLCADLSEMADKAAAVLRGDGYPEQDVRAADLTFRKRFTWERHTLAYERLLQRVTDPGGTQAPILMHANNAMADTANSGVVRVTRRLGRSLQRLRPVLFAAWDSERGEYLSPTAEQYERLSSYGGPEREGDAPISPSWEERRSPAEAGVEPAGGVLLLPEIVDRREMKRIERYARDRGLRICAVFYDAIAVLRPDLCDAEIVENHGDYMLGLAACDRVLAISRFSADSLETYWRDHGVSGGAVLPCLLPGEFGTRPRNREIRAVTPGQARALCVSTLEPRKNHKRLLEAFELLDRQAPDLDWKLTLVGNRYAGAPEIAELVERRAAEDPRIEWRGVVDDETLHRLYLEADFTLYLSEIEGFGLPILESLWHARPCICSDRGVMAELAAAGGCLAVDPYDPEAIATAVRRLATEPEVYGELARQAVRREVKDWAAYAAEVSSALDSSAEPRDANGSAPDWAQTLYPGCLSEKWQMTDSERLALTGLLARRRPRLALEIGSYWGGSLSLLSQFSRAVISVDVDPETSRRCGRFPNVTYLTGTSGRIVPELLTKLAEAGLPLELVLIDADHSESGVHSDIRAFLGYRPPAPLFVLVHDSFNPGCRSGIVRAGWEDSPYCHRVDVDFVPGRIIENGSPNDGELWGGLALAYFRPEPRRGPLHVEQSAAATYQRVAQP